MTDVGGHGPSTAVHATGYVENKMAKTGYLVAYIVFVLYIKICCKPDDVWYQHQFQSFK